MFSPKNDDVYPLLHHSKHPHILECQEQLPIDYCLSLLEYKIKNNIRRKIKHIIEGDVYGS